MEVAPVRGRLNPQVSMLAFADVEAWIPADLTELYNLPKSQSQT
jgi:hypothetical protein